MWRSVVERSSNVSTHIQIHTDIPYMRIVAKKLSDEQYSSTTIIITFNYYGWLMKKGQTSSIVLSISSSSSIILYQHNEMIARHSNIMLYDADENPSSGINSKSKEDDNNKNKRKRHPKCILWVLNKYQCSRRQTKGKSISNRYIDEVHSRKCNPSIWDWVGISSYESTAPFLWLKAIVSSTEVQYTRSKMEMMLKKESNSINFSEWNIKGSKESFQSLGPLFLPELRKKIFSKRKN